MSDYDFVDVTQSPPVKKKPAEAVCFNGIWFDDEIEGFRTLNVQGRELSDKDIDTRDIKKKYGEEFEKAVYRPRTITVTYQLTASSAALFRQYYNELNGYLKAEQAQLIFYDEPDKYFIAAKASNDEVDPGLNSVIGTIEFYCADPVKYSTTLKEFPAAVNDDGVLEAIIVNNGSVEVPVNYEIKHTTENGFIGIISQDGIIQLGKTDEADGYTYQQNEELTDPLVSHNVFNDEPEWYADTGPLCWKNDITVNYPSEVGTDGTLDVADVGDSTVLYLKTPGTKDGLCGATWSYDVQNSEGDGAVNFYAYMNSWFQAGAVTQRGAQVIAFADENNHLICAQVIYKISKSSTVGYTDFYMGDGNGGQKRVQYNTFTAWANDNPYLEGSGWSDMDKEGDKVTFYFRGQYFTHREPALKNVKVHKVQLFIGQYDKGGITIPAYMALNHFRYVRLVIMNVDKYKDVPNRYRPGDVVYIDGETTKIYVNDMVRMKDEIRGSKYFKARPGENKVQFAFSDWVSTKPAVKAWIREACL